MSFRRSSGSNLPPLSSSPFSSDYSNSHRIDPGAGFLPPPRARTPSISASSSSSCFFDSSLPPLSSASSSNFPPDRHGAFSVPPPPPPASAFNSNPPITAITPRMIVCLPCRRAHLKCGKGMRPCAQCIKKGRVEECLEGIPPEQAKLFLRLHYEKIAKEAGLPPPLSKVQASVPIFDDAPLFPLSSSTGSSSSSSSISPSSSLFPQASDTLSYPPLGQLDDMAPQLPVTLIMGQDLRIGKASQEALRTFGYHPHELVNQKLAFYLPSKEREKWQLFSGKMFTPSTPAGAPLPVTPVDLARLDIGELSKPVAGMRSISAQFHWRRHGKDLMPVCIELWFGSYFGATAADFSTFKNAVIVARVTPMHGNALPPSAGRLPIPGFSSQQAAYPSVLLPAPPQSLSSSSFDQFAAPRRSRTPSLSGRTSGLTSSLSSLPPFTSGLPPLASIGSLDGLPPLPPLNTLSMTPRKRRTSTVFPTAEDTFDHGSNLGPLSTRPRLRSPSPIPGHRRSVSSDAGQSFSSSDESLTSLEYDSSSGLPSLQRPPSRNRRPSQIGFQYQLHGGAVPHIPKIFPDSSPIAYPSGIPSFPSNYIHYKPRKQSFIAIDDSYNTPPPPKPLDRPRTPSGNTRNHGLASSGLSKSGHDMTLRHDWPSAPPLPDSFSLMSLDSPPSTRSSPSSRSRY